MRRSLVLVAFFSLQIPARVFAKADISKITIEGADLKTPIEITDPKILANFNVWTGPGTSGTVPKGADRFVIEWSQGATERPIRTSTLRSVLLREIPEREIGLCSLVQI